MPSLTVVAHIDVEQVTVVNGMEAAVIYIELSVSSTLTHVPVTDLNQDSELLIDLSSMTRFEEAASRLTSPIEDDVLVLVEVALDTSSLDLTDS